MSNGVQRLSYPLVRESPTEPPAEYRRLRSEEPVCPISLATGQPAWIVTRHADVKAALSDRRLSREALFQPGTARAQVVEPDPDSMLSMDPPRHTRLRKLANRAFNARRVQQLRPHIHELAHELLDSMAAMSPPVDLNECFSGPLAQRIICELLGVPFADHHRFGEWNAHFMSLTKYTAEEIARANDDMRAYFVRLIASKRREPGDDLLSVLITEPAVDGAIIESELVSLGVLLLLAGHDTTVTVLGGSIVTLLSNPDQLALLRADETLFPAAVEEMVRLNGPGGGTSIRIALTDVKIGDTLIPKGDAVIASVGSACRDESIFVHPDRCDIRRTVGSQIAFGAGPHFCIGASLARAELEIGLRALLNRFPTLRLAVPVEQLRWKDFAALGGWEEIPVAWE